MINSSSANGWPAECAVISTPDLRRGKQVRAVITLRLKARGDVSKAGIIAFTRKHMAG